MAIGNGNVYIFINMCYNKSNKVVMIEEVKKNTETCSVCAIIWKENKKIWCEFIERKNRWKRISGLADFEQAKPICVGENKKT